MTPATPRTALVTGATGYIGGSLVPALLDAGWSVRVLTRSRAGLEGRPVGATTWRWSRVTPPPPTTSVGRSTASRWPTTCCTRWTARAASSSATARWPRVSRQPRPTPAPTRIVYLSGLHPRGELSEHLASRVEVGEIFLDAPVPAAVLQAGVVLGDGSASFDMLRHLTERLPAMVAPRWVDNQIQPIAVDDVVHYLVGAADLPAATQPDLRHRRSRGADLRRDDAALCADRRASGAASSSRSRCSRPGWPGCGSGSSRRSPRASPDPSSAASSTTRSATRTTRSPHRSTARAGRPGSTTPSGPPCARSTRCAGDAPSSAPRPPWRPQPSARCSPTRSPGGTPRSTSRLAAPPVAFPVVWTASTPRSPSSPLLPRPCSPSVTARRRQQLERACRQHGPQRRLDRPVLPGPPPVGRRAECAVLTASTSTSPAVSPRPDGVRPPDCSRMPGGAPSPPPSPQPLPVATLTTQEHGCPPSSAPSPPPHPRPGPALPARLRERRRVGLRHGQLRAPLGRRVPARLAQRVEVRGSHGRPRLHARERHRHRLRHRGTQRDHDQPRHHHGRPRRHRVVGGLPGGVLVHRASAGGCGRWPCRCSTSSATTPPAPSRRPWTGCRPRCPGSGRSRPSRRGWTRAAPARVSSTSTSPAPG